MKAHRPPPWWVLVSSGLSPMLLCGGWLIAGALQGPSYSPVRQTVSVLSGHAGTDRWIVTCALYLVGVCYLVTAAGLAAVGGPARVGLVVSGLTAIGVASFPEPAHGDSMQHAVCTAIGAVAIAVWPALVVQRAAPASVIVSVRASVAVSVISVGLLAWTIVEIHGGSALGLAERASSSVQLCWPFIVALSLRPTARAAISAREVHAVGVPLTARRAPIGRISRIRRQLAPWPDRADS